ncbi:hypothetical protein [Paenibacillus sp. Soil766]|nr:hypothetical protein [Paenibacillus sp. Soil766]
MDNSPLTFTLVGTVFQLAAIDGTNLYGPTDLLGKIFSSQQEDTMM